MLARRFDRRRFILAATAILSGTVYTSERCLLDLDSKWPESSGSDDYGQLNRRVLYLNGSQEPEYAVSTAHIQTDRTLRVVDLWGISRSYHEWRIAAVNGRGDVLAWLRPSDRSLI